jgi:hypothetical protein
MTSRSGKIRGVISLLTTAIVSLLLLVLPVYSNGRTLLNVNGPRVFGLLAVPLVIAAVPLLFPRLRSSAAVAMFVFALVAGFSIGLFYLRRRFCWFGPSAANPPNELDFEF